MANEYSKVVEVSDLGIPIPYNYGRLPDQVVTEEQKFKDKGLWFAQNLQYVCSFYNRPLRNVNVPEQFEDNPGWTNDSLYTPVMNMLKYMLYYQGKQPNLNYNHLTQNIDGTNLQVTWRKGQEIPPLIDHMKGNASMLLQNMKFSCLPLSEKAYSEKTQVYNDLVATLAIKDKLDRFKAMGVEFNPIDGFNPASKDDIDKYMKSDAYKIAGSELATAMAEEIWQDGACDLKYLQAYTYAIICGVGGIEHIVNRGRLEQNVIMPYQLIVDTRLDDDYNRPARFVGVIRNLTPTEVFRKYPQLDLAQKEELQKIAQSFSLGAQYNITNNNFQWWNYGNTYQDSTMTEVTVYWIGGKNLGVKKFTNKYGIDQIGAAPKDNPGNFELDDVHCATILGNRYMTNFGYCTNVSEDVMRKHRPQLPIQVWMPNMIGGESRSLVSRLHAIQDEIDSYRFVQKQIVSRAMGKVLFVRGDMFGNTTSAKELVQDLKAMGIHILTTTGENPVADNQGDKAVNVADLTLDANFMKMSELIMERKAEMQEIISTNKVSLGQQQNYIGAAQQAKAISQSSLGQSTLIDGFMEFVRINVQYDLNVKKNLWASGKDGLKAAVTIGDGGVKYVKATNDLLLEDFLLFIKVKDVIDEAARVRILALAQGWSQNPAFGVTPKAMVQLEKTKTFTEAINVLEESMAQSKRDADKQEEIMAAMEQQKAQMQQQAIQQQQTQQQMASLLTKLEEYDRKGMWAIREIEAKTAASIIEQKALEQAPPMPNQAAA